MTLAAVEDRKSQPADPSNSLAALRPDLAAEWDTERNGTLTPDDVTLGSHKKVWWRAIHDGHLHSWRQVVRNRARGIGCPICAGKQADPSNSLAALRPDLAAEWDTERNGTLTPDDVTLGSNKKVWWRAIHDGHLHSWQQKVAQRARGKGCPICAGQQADPSNSLATLRPDLAAEWDTERNGTLTPDDVVPGSGKKVWWRAIHDGHLHSWQQVVWGRARGIGCPICAGQQADPSNSLAALRPDLAAEWDTERNGTLTPNDVVPGSNKKVWWRAIHDGHLHSWQQRVADRAGGIGCPFCSRRWSKDKLERFVASLLSHRGQYTWAEIISIMEIAAMPRGARQFITGKLGLTPLRGDEYDPTTYDPGDEDPSDEDPGDEDELCGGDSVDDPFALLPTCVDGGDLIDDTLIDDTLDPTDTSPGDTSCGGEVGTEPGVLTTFKVAKILSLGEDLIGLPGMGDAQVAEYLKTSRVAKLWTLAYANPAQVAEATQEPLDNEYQETARAAFREEFDAAWQLEIPANWTFRASGTTEVTPGGGLSVTQPNLMQLHAAAMIVKRPCFGNWSGTGTGKTASAVLAARLLRAGMQSPGIVMVVCPNNTIDGWKRTIESCFRDVVVETKTLTPTAAPNGKQHWYLVNFEMLSQRGVEDKLASLLQSKRVDLLVVDEVQFVKQRGASATKRRKALLGFRAQAAAENPDMKVVVMSATPVINSLPEAVSLLELLTGHDMSHLDTKGTIHNAVAIHRELVTAGIRCKAAISEMPEPRFVDVDANSVLDDLLALHRPTPLDYERTLLPVKLDVIVRECLRGGKSLIYTEFKEEIRSFLMDALSAAGLRVGQFDGDKKELDAFIGVDRTGGAARPLDPKDHLDVLIGTKPIGTGVDGLQYHAARLIFATLPWTSADYQQIVGRIWRQGRPAALGGVDIVIPIDRVVYDRPDGSSQEWSYAANRWNLVQAKRTLADAAVDGVKPDWVAEPNPRLVVESVHAWLQRIVDGSIVDSPSAAAVQATLSPAPGGPGEPRSTKATIAEFSRLNNRWSVARSSSTQERLAHNADEWHRYHELYRQARETWGVIPAHVFAEWLAGRSDGRTVADLGCGEMLLADRLDAIAPGHNHSILGFDHVAVDDRVTACDIAQLDLADRSVDIAVLSLALMGINHVDYVAEAHRILRVDGQLWIAEPTKRIGSDVERLSADLGDLGFDMVGGCDVLGPFTFARASRSARQPVRTVTALVGAALAVPVAAGWETEGTASSPSDDHEEAAPAA